MALDQEPDVIIIGAGAAGLAAAIFAAEAARARAAPLHVVLLERARKPGAKILVSGGGRCNVTHTQVSADDYHGKQTFVRNVLRAFDAAQAVQWFTALGVPLKTEDTGKLFPTSDDAATVLDALLRRAGELGVELRCGACVVEAARTPHGFTLTLRDGTALRAPRAILATGGRSLPKSGSDGLGWELARRLGHSVTPTYPALVPLKLAATFFHAQVAGTTLPARLYLKTGSAIVETRSGSLLWTHFGVSGPVAMDISRTFNLLRGQGQAPQLLCALLAEMSAPEVDALLLRWARQWPRRALATCLRQVLPERLVEVLCRHAGVEPATQSGQLTRAQRGAVVRALTELELPVTESRGWNHAEVTAGGVPLDEVDFRTLASRRCPGLYLVGEMLDCDGRIGGFNFQWAWATGYLAGNAAASSAALAP